MSFLFGGVTAGFSQSVGSGFTLIQELEIGSTSTGVINDLKTGIDLDSDGYGEFIIQIGQSSNAKAMIYEWNGTDSYDEVWSVSLPVNNASSDQIQRLVSVNDTDGDGYLELFIASNSTSSSNARVYCYEMASGQLSSTNPPTSSKGPDGGYFKANARIRAIVTGNADGDNYKELYVGNAGNTTSLEVWEADGDDSWSKVSLVGAEKNIGDGIMDMGPPNDLDNDGYIDDLPICEEQGALRVMDFSTLADPTSAAINNNMDTGTNTYGKIVTYNLDNSGSPEIVISNNIDDGIFVFEWESGSNAFVRDKTDAVLLSAGNDIYGMGTSDYDNDGKGEIYFTYQDDVKYFEYSSSGGDFDAASDFSSSTDMVVGLLNNAYVFQPSPNLSTTLLDGDSYRDIVIGTDGHGTSGRGEIFIFESTTPSIIPKVEISGSSGFRMMSSPVSGSIFTDLLSELWIQGMSGGDISTGTANVWTFNKTNQTWSALTNLSTATLSAGEGFLVYVYDDSDGDGTGDLPISLSVEGAGNTGSVSIENVSDGNWALAGNPYSETIDWDNVSKTNILSSAYIWDNVTGAFKSWNGSIGSLTDGHIAPYQGFWVQASGGTGSLTIESSDMSSTTSAFFRSEKESAGGVSLTFTFHEHEKTIYLSFTTGGDIDLDIADAYQLMPLEAKNHLIAMTYTEKTALAINNLPSFSERPIHLPVDVMFLTVDDYSNFLPNKKEITIQWDLSRLPETIIGLSLKNNNTGETANLLEERGLKILTQAKDKFSIRNSKGVNIYPKVGESLLSLIVQYLSLSVKEESTFPTKLRLHPANPNPFNPSTFITVDIPNTTEAHHKISLRIFDINGRLVETLIDGELEHGRHCVRWSPINLSSGLYIVQLKSENHVSTQKLTYMK